MFVCSCTHSLTRRNATQRNHGTAPPVSRGGRSSPPEPPQSSCLFLRTGTNVRTGANRQRERVSSPSSCPTIGILPSTMAGCKRGMTSSTGILMVPFSLLHYCLKDTTMSPSKGMDQRNKNEDNPNAACQDTLSHRMAAGVLHRLSQPPGKCRRSRIWSLISHYSSVWSPEWGCPLSTCILVTDCIMFVH